MRDDVKVEARISIRDDGATAAATKYAGQKGHVTMIGAGWNKSIVDANVDGNDFDTVFEQGDVAKIDNKG